MPTLMFNPKYKGKRYMVVSSAEASKVRRQLMTPDVPGDLSEARYEFLRHIDRIFDPEALEQPVRTYGVQQGMYQAIPKGDR